MGVGASLRVTLQSAIISNVCLLWFQTYATLANTLAWIFKDSPSKYTIYRDITDQDTVKRYKHIIDKQVSIA